MPIIYKNFRDDTYYLHSKLTTKGNTTYYFSKEAEGAAELDQVPSGYEIYENPNGNVYMRKEQKPVIQPEEINVINNGMIKYSEIKDFKLDIKKNAIFIYTVDPSISNGSIPKQLLHKYKQYATDLRFVLVDKEERIFEVERFCYKGGIDDWIFLDQSNDLEKLVQDYIQHLGKDSFYELM
ncbi:hypothetical protein [Alkalihalobacterium chitinilyticum]|uniref:Uncharacterized protein n=1 Tax=Alkalihalobacterium chitinilyticum TaxID=2980103 RepID=A0ABT5VHR0_9BACI|nr:hypothetical protein [Alkalihalobacterium chitinilyticum]MDE5413998.1 hypothetical protein [Alkalihalobacterium chitinilyticum]